MKKFFAILSLFLTANVYSQSLIIDSLKSAIENHNSKFEGLDERLAGDESDLSGLTKIKVSGYIQAQWDYYDAPKTTIPNNTFYLRRTRLKTTYEPADGVKFVLQPDFSPGNFSLKAGYAQINDPWLKTCSIIMGEFDRPDYEVEYSSSSLEALERSRVIRAIYPNEQELGAKLEIKPKKIPIKFQLAAMNGNFTGVEAKDVDNGKDFMPRIVYTLNLPKKGMGIELGAHGYFGSVKTLNASKYTLKSDNSIDSTSSKVGDYLNLQKQWFGGEARFYWDFLGGLSIKAEYLAGQTAIAGTSTSTVSQSGGTSATVNSGGTVTTTTSGQSSTTKKVVTPNKYRNFSGYYLYFIKNIGKNDQFVLKYDNYDPNTSLSGDKAGSELYYNTLTVAWQHYWDSNIKITLAYQLPKNETNISTKKDLLDNTFSVRVQASF